MTERNDSGFTVSAVAGLGRILPYIGVVVATATFLVVLGMGRPDLGLKGLYLAGPIIIASIWLIRSKGVGESAAEEDTPWMALSSVRFSHLTLLSALIFVVSIVMLVASVTRPPAYFILMAAFVGIVLVQILGMANHSGWQKGVILVSLVLLVLNLTWGITLKYPLYVGATDIPAHLFYMESISEYSRVTSVMDTYQFTPLYHILVGSGAELLGLEVRDGFFVLLALAYVVVIPLAYLVFRTATGSERISLLACSLFAVSSELMYYGSYMVMRAFAFVLFVMVLHLLFRQPRNRSTTAVLSIATIALLLAHQTTIVYAAGILGLLVGFQWLLARPHPVPAKATRFASLYLFGFIVAFVSYWIVVSSAHVHYFMGRFAAEIGHVPPSVVAPPTDGGPGVTVTVPLGSAVLAFIRDRAADMIFLFLAWPGFAYLLRRARGNPYSACTSIGLVSVLCLVFYVASPIHLIPQFTHLFLIYRVALLLTVFMSLAMAYGAIVLAKSLTEHGGALVRSAALPVLVALLVAFSFFSMTNVKNASDVPGFRNPYFGERAYFTAAELRALSFAEEQASPEISLYSGYVARRYFVDRPADVITHPDIGYIESGFVILRIGELKDRWLFFSRGTFGLGIQLYSYNLDGVEPADNILEHLASQDKIYDNGAARSYIIGTD